MIIDGDACIQQSFVSSNDEATHGALSDQSFGCLYLYHHDSRRRFYQSTWKVRKFRMQWYVRDGGVRTPRPYGCVCVWHQCLSNRAIHSLTGTNHYILYFKTTGLQQIDSCRVNGTKRTTSCMLRGYMPGSSNGDLSLKIVSLLDHALYGAGFK